MVYHILDIETTGFNRGSDNILEVGYLRCDSDLNIIGHGVLYFYKDEYNVESTQHIHGLSREFLSQFASDFTPNLCALYTLIKGANVVGKNSNSFDIPFIMRFLQRNLKGVELAEVNNSIDIQPLMYPYFKDYMYRTTGEVIGPRRFGKLEEYIPVIGMTMEQVKESYAEQFGVERASAHSALFDAYMTYLVLRWIAIKKGSE